MRSYGKLDEKRRRNSPERFDTMVSMFVRRESVVGCSSSQADGDQITHKFERRGCSHE